MKNWKYTSYKQMGKHHSICQDFVKVSDSGSKITACLCDGLGSLNNSHVAAELTANTVMEFLQRVTLDESAVRDPEALAGLREDVIHAVQERLRRAASEQNVSPASMDCTLLFVCVFKNENIALLGDLGDSAVCVIRESGAQLFSDNTISSTGTRAVQDEDAAQHLRLSVLPLDDVRGFILTSDGLENEIYYKGLNYVAKGAQLYLNALLSSIPQKVIQGRIRELTEDSDTIFDDDISVAVISCADKPVELDDEPTWPCVCGNHNPLSETFCTECGRDFIDLYKNVDLSDGRYEFFAELQRRPERREALMQALQSADAEIPKNPFAPLSEPEPEPAAENEAAFLAGEMPQEIYSQTPEPPRSIPEGGAAAGQGYIPPAGGVAPQPEPERVPAARIKKNPITPYAIIFMAIAFVVGAFLGAMIMAAVKNNAISDLEARLRRGESPIGAITLPVTPETPQPETTVIMPPTEQPEETTAPEVQGVEGTWSPRYFLVNGERTELSADSDVVFTFEFRNDNTVTRRHSIDPPVDGTYLHNTENGDHYILSFSDGQTLTLAYNREERTLTLSNGAVQTIYAKNDLPSESQVSETPSDMVPEHDGLEDDL